MKLEHLKKLTFLEHQIGETGTEDCGASWGLWSSDILATGLNCVIGWVRSQNSIICTRMATPKIVENRKNHQNGVFCDVD